MKNTLVSNIMTREPLSVNPDANLLECAKTMVRKRIGSLLIIGEGRLYGIITTQDILWALIKKDKEDLDKIRAIDISPKKIITIKPNASIEEALNKIKKTKIERLPVIQDNEIVGLITIKDILNFHPEIYPELREFAQIVEEEEKLRRIEEKNIEFIEIGMCEECGKQDSLQRFNGMLVCEHCISSM